jgi:hypothetical protein
MKKLRILAAVLAVCFPLAVQAADAPVGSIKTVRGTALILRDTKPVDTRPGTKVLRKDLLRTGADGAIAMIFRDDTLLSLGPNSELSVDEFLYSPAEGKLSLVTRMLKGTAAYVSGIIGKLSPESVRFETPVATIGIRGTKFAVSVEGEDD